MGCSLILQIAQGPSGIHEFYGAFRSPAGALWSHKVSRSPMGRLLTPWVVRSPMGYLLTPLIAQESTCICGSHGVSRSPMVALWRHRVSSDSSGCLLVPCVGHGCLGFLLTPRTAQGLTSICKAPGMSRSPLGALWSHRVSRDPVGCLLTPRIPRCPMEHSVCPLSPEATAQPGAPSPGTSPPEALWGPAPALGVIPSLPGAHGSRWGVSWQLHQAIQKVLGKTRLKTKRRLLDVADMTPLPHNPLLSRGPCGGTPGPFPERVQR